MALLIGVDHALVRQGEGGCTQTHHIVVGSIAPGAWGAAKATNLAACHGQQHGDKAQTLHETIVVVHSSFGQGSKSGRGLGIDNPGTSRVHTDIGSTVGMCLQTFIFFLKKEKDWA